ncbi:MAG: putative nucleotidyltransferase substrate binding domain-containing protein [Solirubrobacteraceae bacterium]
MSATGAAPSDIVRFLLDHPPFDALGADRVQSVADTIEVEEHPAGTTIISQGADPVEHLRVVRSGTIEIVHDGTVLDLLGEGELFGHASMLSGLPTGFEARAAEDVICYRIDAEVARTLLSDPAGLRFVARSLLERPSGLAAADVDARDPAHEPVGALLRGPPVVCGPQTPIRDVVDSMSAGGATCAVIDLADGTLGIVTDRDLRTRVLAAGLGGDAPASAAMSAPAYTCRPDQLGGDILLEMLDRGFRHFPVVSATGRIVGVIEDLDLIAAHARSSFFLRQRIGGAQTIEELIAAARELVPTVIAMHEARVAATNIMAVYSVVVDALTRRVLELEVRAAQQPFGSFAWLALGSQARREMVPSSDIDTAVVWFGNADEAVRPRLQSLGAKVVGDLEACGMRPDPHAACASNPAFVRSVSSWQDAARSWIEDPTQEKALILASVLVDSRPVWGVHTGTPVADTFLLAERGSALLRMLARFALSHRPPTGFLRGLVVEHGGEHRGRLDLKHGGVIPIVDLARWAGMAAGVTSASTIERLRAAGTAGTLPASDAQTLEDAFELIAALRVQPQVRQLRAEEPPDDYVDPAELSGLTRSHLKEAFRAVASVQKRVAAELKAGTL